MFTMNLSKLNINEAELKAYIYQQLNDIQPFVGEASVAIKMAYTEDENFIVKMIYNHNEGAIEAESSGKDIFNTISKAKRALINNVNSLTRAFDFEERETPQDSQKEVTSMIEKKTVH